MDFHRSRPRGAQHDYKKAEYIADLLFKFSEDMKKIIQISLLILFATEWAWAGPLSEEQVADEVRAISKTLRCAVCQSESVWESNAELAAQMRAIVRERVMAGESGDEIRAYFVGRYGDFILLAPRVRGLNNLLWFGPFLLLGGVGIYLIWRIRAWVKQAPPQEALAPIDEDAQRRIEAALKAYMSGEK